MASIGKFLASAVSFNSEIQASLASLTFDFSVIKVEAPAEYAGVGSSLTKLRRRDAEDGTSHTTARKLAALFADEIPIKISLFKAYGHRATEISVSPVADTNTTARHGAFADHAGTDGTTVWAAATSGNEALAIHLLSCLLARIWAPDEAVAVWWQLVKERKARLLNQVDVGSSFHTSSFFASKVELSRSHLVAWDANTRAWLSSADRVKKREQTQLRLVIDNITLPVSPVKTLYESVIQTWTTSMGMMEDLLNGKSLKIQSGELLLGLSSWHIYPNLSVITDQTTQVIQHDTLVPEHVFVTVGLISKPEEAGSGIHWSLPLAHLRHYGKPIVRTRHSGLGESCVPFTDLVFVALGSIFRTWQKSDTDFTESIKLLGLISDNFLHIEKPVAPWLAPLDKAIRRYQSLTDLEKVTAHQFIRLGYRYSRSFMASEMHQPPPAFGLTELRYLLRICSRAEDRIKLLRYWARKNLRNSSNAVIRYFMPGSNIKYYALVEMPEKKQKRKRDHADYLRSDHPEHWTERKAQRGRVVSLGDSLRVPLDDPRKWSPGMDADGQSESYTTGESTSSIPVEDWLIQEYLRDFPDPDERRQMQDEQVQAKINELQDDIARQSRRKAAAPVYLALPASRDAEEVGERDPSIAENESETFWVPFPAWTHCEGEEKLKPYHFVAGVLDLAAIFVPGGIVDANPLPNSLTCGQLEQLLRRQVKDNRCDLLSIVLARHIWHVRLEQHYPLFIKSIRALHWADDLYQHLPDAYVDLRIRAKPLHTAHYYAANRKEKVLDVSENDSKMRQTFSCIALFETGSIDIPPMDFGNVMAICHQDSIYVAHRLLQDPSDRDPACLITRIAGNVGKPGLSILHPPLEPEVRPFDVETSWHLANYHPFDGNFEDNFSATSLHLSFTGSSVAYGTTTSGDIHHNVHFVETLVQAYDKGKWIADLDILGARRKVQHGWPSFIKQTGSSISTTLCMVDSWDELLGVSPSHAVFRAHKNWMARLAAVTVLVQLQRSFRVIACDDTIPNYASHIENNQKTSQGHRELDKDAEEILEPWLKPNRDYDRSQDGGFEDVLRAEIGDIESYNFSNTDSSTSGDEETDEESSPKDGDDKSHDGEQLPSTLSNMASRNNPSVEEALILIC